MSNRRSRIHAGLLGGAASIALLMSAGVANAETGKRISIAPQSLASALHEFGVQSGHQVIFKPASTASKTTSGVNVDGDVQTALTQLLAGTGLTYRRAGDIFLIEPQDGGGSGPQGAGAEAVSAVEELIVTAQKKEEQIQDVPIAISAFTQKSLDAQKIEGGFDLLKAIPNVTFSKNNFSGYNFSIRGVGTKAVSATTDPGVAVSFNNTTLIVNRLFEQEYFDVERVEVLRGPQGTLYGRNATSGVINLISAKPRLGEFEGDLKLEVGNYNAQRVRGMVNIPIGETLAIRAAGAMTKRDGYGYNEATDSDVDGRDLWSSRVTVGWEPLPQLRADLLWEHFEEDDDRSRTSKQLCHHDPGPQQIASFDWADSTANLTQRAITSQGCLPGSLYDDAAFGTPNGASLPYVVGLGVGSGLGGGTGGNPFFNSDQARCAAERINATFPVINVCQPDPYGGAMQSRDLRTIDSSIVPIYRAKADVLDLTINFDLSDSLTFTSQTVLAQDEYFSSQDFNRFSTVPIWNDSAIACGGIQFFAVPILCDQPGTYHGGLFNVTPGGIFTDPQLGPSASLAGRDLSKAQSEQFNQEFRVASNFDAPINFSLGANFTRFETMNDYYVFINALTLLTKFFPFTSPFSPSVTNPCSFARILANECVYVDPNPFEAINGEGHNYFRSANPYELNSSAIFGEIYWQATDTLKFTAGVRMTWDRKTFTPIPSQLLLWDYRLAVNEGEGPEFCIGQLLCSLAGTGVNGRGSPPNPAIEQEWREPTGRLIVDWKPELGFTDETMVYASYAHGYKGGGANPPTIAPPAGLLIAENSGGAAPPTFGPEFVDAFELGTKNTLMGGALVLNASAFHYDYEGYQVSKIVDRSAANENFDAKIWGLELEWIFSPIRNLRFNGTVGHLNTEIAEGERSIDLMDRVQGGHHSSYLDENGVEHALGYDQWMVIKPWITNSSNCVIPVAIAEALLNAGQYGNMIVLCGDGGPNGGNFKPGGPVTIPGIGFWDPTVEAPNKGAGFFAELGGHELPNAPHWTASLGGQYRFALPGGWDATLRGDFYWQSQSFARVYNTQYDKLRAWTNTNVSLWMENPDWGVTAEVYVKNVFDETPITDAFLNSDDSGLTTNVFTLDPRLIGVSVRKSF